MANEEHLELLKQGIAQWNEWRKQYTKIFPDLSNADLSNADLSNAHLFGADLSNAHLSRADLSRANLSGAKLICANLSNAQFFGADLNQTNLEGANLSRANLVRADLSGANLNGTNLQLARAYETIFASLDLSAVKGLIEIYHRGPSRVELYTVQLPQDGSALHFLRGAGVPDEWIDFWRTTIMHPIQYHSLFISYSSKDNMFASRLHADLQVQGVRCWFAPEDMKIGEKIRSRIDKEIHLQVWW